MLGSNPQRGTREVPTGVFILSWFCLSPRIPVLVLSCTYLPTLGIFLLWMIRNVRKTGGTNTISPGQIAYIFTKTVLSAHERNVSTFRSDLEDLIRDETGDEEQRYGSRVRDEIY